MAEVDKGKGSQLAHATNTLNYGHLGTAKYREGAREWSFLRRFVDLRTSQAAFPFVLVKRETVYENSTSNDELLLRTHNLSRSSAGGHETYSHSAPLDLGSANANEEESLSRAIITSLDQYDPLLSDRLAFGSASWLLDNDVRSGNAIVPVVALASGANGDCVTFTQIGMGRATVTDENDNDFVVKVPTITANNNTSWTSGGEAVQQICSAATSGYRSTWMAARLLSSTTIFHPLFHRKPVPEMMHSNIASSIRTSLLDANPILTIPISRTGGHLHADISFHPVDCHLLALIDQRGNWSTWQIDGKRSVTSRTLFRVQLLRAGKLCTWETLSRPPQAEPYHDGWHKICWVADGSGKSNNVFLANRRIGVIQSPFDNKQYFMSLGLGQASEAQWILDLKKSTLRPGWIFVLTSTRVLCISTAGNQKTDMSKIDPHTILCSWQHFRGRKDFTLSLTILETAHCAIILLWSRFNTIVNAYRINSPSEHPSVSLSWIEPSLLKISDLCAQSDVQSGMKSPLTLFMRPAQMQRLSKAPDKPLAFPLPKLFKLFVLHADRSVSEILLQSAMELSALEDHDNPNTILLPPENNIRNRSSKYADLEELDDLIVQDTQDILHCYLDLNEGSHEHLRNTQDKSVLKVDLASDWREVYELIVEWSTNVPPRKRMEFDGYVQAIRPTLEKSASTQPGVRLLSDLSSPLPLVADAESSSATITFLVESSTTKVQDSPVFYSLPTRLQSKSSLELYQSLVSHWLSPLPPEVPDRIRVNKERLSRNIAADLALAGTAIKPFIRNSETNAVQERIYPDSAPASAVTLIPSLDLDLVDTTAHSQSASSLPPTAGEHLAYIRLRAYSKVSNNTVTSVAPASVLGILAHLPSDPEIDPSTYDWRTTEAAITAEHDESAETADPRVRRRAEKLAQAKHKRIQLQKKAAEELLWQRAPPAIGSSQMVLPTRELQSSQVMAPERNVSSDFGPMTQPERGVFGTRLGGTGAWRKDKGKKRAAGF